MGSNSSSGTLGKVKSLLPKSNGSEGVLNLGCGGLRFEDNGYFFLNVDKEGKCDQLHDLNKDYPWKTGMWSGAVAIEVLEHLENWHHFLRETMRVVQKWIIITFPNILAPKGQKWYLKRRYKGDGHITVPHAPFIEAYCEEMGWRVSNVEYNNDEKEIVVMKIDKA